MNSSGIFISSKNPGYSEKLAEVVELSSMYICFSKTLRPKLYLYESDQFFLFAHVNMRCRKYLISMGDKAVNLLNDQNSSVPGMNWGFILILNRVNNKIRIINDIYGIYPLYYSQEEDQILLSNDADLILRRLPSLQLDEAGLYDFLLFNYPLNNRTLFKNLFRVQGGSLIESDTLLENINIKRSTEIDALIHKSGRKKENLKKGVLYLEKNLEGDLEPELPIQLPLSGGFDSKMLLAILLKRNELFSTYTYGSRGSVDQTSAEHTAGIFGLQNKLLDLATLSTDKLEQQARQFIKRTPARPMILDLLAYECVNEEIAPSNIILGAMGGELINGPVVVSEVILTRSVKSLTRSITVEELKNNLRSDLASFPFINIDVYRESEDNYAASLTDYLGQEKDKLNRNLTRFMLKEVYPGFFGTVFSSLMGRFNLINPFTDLNFLSWLLNSGYRYSRHRSFSKNPVSHLFSRRLYARMIRLIYPPALYSKMDRNYLLADILYPYRWPVTVLRYIENHLFKKNKTEQAKTLNYTRWMRPLIIEHLKKSPLLENRIFNKSEVLSLINSLEKEQPVPDIQLRKLILMLGIHYLAEEYNFVPA